MTTTTHTSPSLDARLKIRASRGDPLFLASWRRVLLIHLTVEPEVLRPHVPFPLDLHEGKAIISLVAFNQEDLRPRFGGLIGGVLFQPIASHTFLNVRTYVRHGVDAAIFFLAEFIPNQLAAWLGPRTFGLPYRHGTVDLNHHVNGTELTGSVLPTEGGGFKYTGGVCHTGPPLKTCVAGTFSHFLLERYTALTMRGRHPCFFRVWHEPWEIKSARITITQLDLPGLPWEAMTQHGAHYAPGLPEVWLSRPHRYRYRSEDAALSQSITKTQLQ